MIGNEGWRMERHPGRRGKKATFVGVREEISLIEFLDSFLSRCGMCALTQLRRVYFNNNETATTNTSRTNAEESNVEPNYRLQNHMYIIGGFAGWPRTDKRWNGDRTRNDVWITTDGINWSLILPPKGKNTMPFIGRAWHACANLHDTKDPSQGVQLQSAQKLSSVNGGEHPYVPSKLYLSGGGYMGTKGNSDVRTLEGYVDLWWSYNGSMWFKVNHEQGEKRSLYSTNEWTTATGENDPYHNRGKWGHSMISFFVEEDLNLDGEISPDESTSIEFCAGDTKLKTDESKKFHCKEFLANENFIPSLFVIGGDTTDGGPIVNDVYVSKSGLHCEIEGVTCSNRGSCGPGTIGCICNSNHFSGEYCEIKDNSDRSSGFLEDAQPRFLTLAGVIAIQFYIIHQ